MLPAWWSGFGASSNDQDNRDGEPGDRQNYQDQVADEQPNGWSPPYTSQGGGLEQASTLSQGALRALWDVDEGGTFAPAGGAAAGGATAAGAAAASAASAQQQAQNQRQNEGQRQAEYEPFEEDAQERAERIALENRENLAVRLLKGQELNTIGEAADYCKALVQLQLQRAQDANPPPAMNEPMYGDAHARRAITTLLPDTEIRELFLETTRQQRNWPRMRPLFGTPPYQFLRPEDAGLVRAAGIAASRTNMTYERTGETASYSQFGSGHLVDEYAREYRVLPIALPKQTDGLPYDLENIESQSFVYMNVRVPKRSKQEKHQLLKDQRTRRAVVFPHVGEVLVVRYSSGLRAVWRSEKTLTTQKARVIVKRMVPRSANASTAALIALRV